MVVIVTHKERRGRGKDAPMNNNYRVRHRVMNIAVEPVHEAYRRSRRS